MPKERDKDIVIQDIADIVPISDGTKKALNKLTVQEIAILRREISVSQAVEYKRGKAAANPTAAT